MNKIWGDFSKAVQIAQVFVGEVLRPGDTAVDATAGNGYDTLFLAQMVGKHGKVYAFDIQEEALEKTRRRLQEAGLDKNVVLLATGHQYMQEIIGTGTCRAVIFNLGYLPGGSKKIKTEPETTRQGIEQAVNLLVPGGRMSIVVYTGHSGADEEAQTVDNFIANLAARYFWTARITFPNRNRAPYVILVQKKAGDEG